ncbi:MAG: carbon starvation protein A [Persicimonas sp.]
MNAAVATAFAFAAYVAGYLIYSRYLSERVFELREDAETPAHALEDGIDYVPTRSGVLFGHHYASIAGLAPMLGPAVAVIWGWLPAMCWVVVGALMVGCVHDMGSLVVSVRAQGKSIGAVAEGIIGSRAKTLLHIIIFFLVALAMGVFVWVIAFLFSPAPDPSQAHVHFPQAVLPSFGLMAIAAAIGWLGFKKGVSWKWMVPVGFGLLLALIVVAQDASVMAWLRLDNPDFAPGVDGWSGILVTYAFFASVLPVWSLLQPRDFLNCLLLYLGLGSLYLGLFVAQPDFVAPAVRMNPEGAPGLFPFVFIVIACGAASGFHSLVASGTTAKQLDNEKDARFVGYGGMIGESLLGLIAVLATTAGVISSDKWHVLYSDWAAVQALGAKVSTFINGCGRFLEALGLPHEVGASFVSVIVVSYALTSLDSATRLLRYNVEEIAETVGVEFLKNRYLSSLIAVAAIGFFAFYKIDGQSAGLALWQLFGTTNQIMAALALLVVTLYLLMRQKPWYVAGIPMVAMLATTITAMVSNAKTFLADGKWLLFGVGTFLLVLAVWLVIEAAIAVVRFREDGHVIESLDINI